MDEVTGIVRKQDLIDQVLDGRSPDVEQVTRPPPHSDKPGLPRSVRCRRS
jgi:hypothetical protein